MTFGKLNYLFVCLNRYCITKLESLSRRCSHEKVKYDIFNKEKNIFNSKYRHLGVLGKLACRKYQFKILFYRTIVISFVTKDLNLLCLENPRCHY